MDYSGRMGTRIHKSFSNSLDHNSDSSIDRIPSSSIYIKFTTHQTNLLERAISGSWITDWGNSNTNDPTCTFPHNRLSNDHSKLLFCVGSKCEDSHSDKFIILSDQIRIQISAMVHISNSINDWRDFSIPGYEKTKSCSPLKSKSKKANKNI